MRIKLKREFFHDLQDKALASLTGWDYRTLYIYYKDTAAGYKAISPIILINPDFFRRKMRM